MAVDADADAVADLVLGLVGLRQLNPKLAGLVQDGHGDGVVELLLRRRGKPEDVGFAKTIRGDDAAHFGAFPGQRPRLVEQHGVDLAHQFERPPVFHQNALLGAQGQR